jgi:hypothetical protein
MGTMRSANGCNRRLLLLVPRLLLAAAEDDELYRVEDHDDGADPEDGAPGAYRLLQKQKNK